MEGSRRQHKGITKNLSVINFHWNKQYLPVYANSRYVRLILFRKDQDRQRPSFLLKNAQVYNYGFLSGLKNGGVLTLPTNPSGNR